MTRLVATLSLFLAVTAGAQTVSGRVTDRTSGMPVAGVVVSALDASGAALARTVTDSASGYRVPILSGVMKLHFRRIGYSPSTVPLADSSSSGRIDVVLTRLPTVLPPVKAMVVAQCDAAANQPDALALWEETRSALLTSLVARESKAAYASVLLYEASIEGDDEQPRSVRRIELPPGVTSAFVAGGDPERLARDGYLIREGITESFAAPDDRVLFDESFLTTSCFTLEKVTDDSLVGIHFEGGKGRKVVGVSGTVWLRREPLDIVSVEYTYTNVDRAIQRAKPGGSIQFRKMPNGITMISQWRIRSATAAPPPSRVGSRTIVLRPGSSASARSQVPRARDPIAHASETGAIIEVMQWPDAPPYVASLATVSGVLIDKYSKKPLLNTPIRFFHTPFATTTDSTGAFRFVDVLPGLYEMEAGDFELDKFGAASELIGPIAIRYGANSLNLDGEGPEAAVVRGCGEKVDGRADMPKQLGGKNAIFGVLAPAMRFQVEFRAEVTPAGAVAGTAGFPIKGKTDKLGRFRICGLPDGSVKLSARIDNAFGADTVVVDPLHPYRLVTLKLARPTGSQP